MSGITSGVGLASGINSQQIIDQLMALEARPKTLLQGRIRTFQLQQTAVLDINSRLNKLRDMAKVFRDAKTFDLMRAVSGDDKVLTATGSAGAAAGTYQFIVDRMVTAQQSLTRGWASRDAAVGATSFTFESAKARLATDVNLSDLNGGAGIARGKITITDSAGKTATVDLSKAATVQDVLDGINNNGVAAVSVSIEDGRLVVKDSAGGTGNVVVANAVGSTTAASLGIAGTAAAGGSITGSDIYTLSRDTALGSLNDGNGVTIKPVSTETGYNFELTIVQGGVTKNVKVNLSDVFKLETVGGQPQLVKKEGAVTTVGGVMDRINKALDDQGLGGIRAEIAPGGKGLRLTDASGAAQITVAENGSTTAADLGLRGTTTGSMTGTRLIAGLNSVLGGSLNGGAGIGGDGFMNFTTRDGFSFSVGGVMGQRSLEDIMRGIESASGTTAGGKSRLTVSLNQQGTGLLITDNTGGTGNLVITGTDGADTAASLKISTGASGVASSTVNSGNLQRRYVSTATTLASMNGGKGIGTGVFRITDATGKTTTVDIGSDSVTLGDVIDEINSRDIGVTARVNQNGDGLELVEKLPPSGIPGATAIRVEDVSGSVARNLSVAGAATGTGAANTINGTQEKTVSFLATDSLTQIAQKINAAGAGISASVINDGAGATPFRLSLTSTATGRAGRMIIDSGALDLGLRTLETGEDARVFFGSSDPARGVLVTSSTNTLDNVIANVKIDLKSTSASAVSLTLSSDTDAITTGINDFIKAFNETVDRINEQSKYDKDSGKRGPLLGDSTMIALRSALFSAVQGDAQGVTGRYTRLTQVGVRVGSGGKLTLDETALRNALTADPEAVRDLFTARTVRTPPAGTNTTPGPTQFSALGVPGQIEELVSRYTSTVDGVLTGKSQGITNLIDSSNSRITQLDARLAQKRARLEAKFAAMERSIAQLQSQQSALSSIRPVS